MTFRRRTRSKRPHRAGVIVAAASIFLVALALLALLAPLLAPYDPLKQNLADALLPPGSSGTAGLYLLGTDELGRDTLSRLMYGIRPIAVIALVSTAVATVLGSLVGLLAGVGRRLFETVIMRIADIQLSVPPIILAIVLAVALQPGVVTAAVAITLVTWPQYARVVRAETARIKTSDFIRLARVAGVRGSRLLIYHFVPNVLSVVVVLATLNLSIAIIFAASLSFLGVGVQAPTPDWGNMLSGGTQYLEQWWMVTFPGLAITLTVLALNLVGDHVRDRMDPRLRERSADGADHEDAQVPTIAGVVG